MDKTIPQPCGWRILVKPQEAQEKSKGGVLLPDDFKDVSKYASVIAQVVAMGDDCYADAVKFAHPWCKVGDWIMIAKHTGWRFKVNGEDYKIINDDEVVGTVDDPSKIEVNKI